MTPLKCNSNHKTRPWDLLCPEQSYVSLDAIMQVFLVGNSWRMATIPRFWIWQRHTETRDVRVARFWGDEFSNYVLLRASIEYSDSKLCSGSIRRYNLWKYAFRVVTIHILLPGVALWRALCEMCCLCQVLSSQSVVLRSWCGFIPRFLVSWRFIFFKTRLISLIIISGKFYFLLWIRYWEVTLLECSLSAGSE